MKKKKLSEKLSLKKETIIGLGPEKTSRIFGGVAASPTGRWCSMAGSGCTPTKADVSCSSECTCGGGGCKPALE